VEQTSVGVWWRVLYRLGKIIHECTVVNLLTFIEHNDSKHVLYGKKFLWAKIIMDWP